MIPDIPKTYQLDEVKEFIRLINISVYLFSFLFLIFIWFYMRKKTEKAKSDFGLPLLSLYLLVSVFTMIYKNNHPLEQASSILKMLSSFQNCFLLAALVYFDKPNQIFRKPEYRLRWVLLMFLVGIVISIVCASDDISITRLIDLSYSIISVGSVGFAIVYSFYKRKYNYLLIGLSIFFTLLIIYVQKFTLSTPSINFDSALLVSMNIVFVILLLLTSQTWVTEELLRKKNDEIQELGEYHIEMDKQLETISDDNEKGNEKGNEKVSEQPTIARKIALIKLKEKQVLYEMFKNPDFAYYQIGLALNDTSEHTIISRFRSVESKLGIRGKKEVIGALQKEGYFNSIVS